MTVRYWPVAGLMILGALSGCKSVTPPSLDHPRSADIQQKRALRYDPYPETGIGTDISTVRPRNYQDPPAEPSQSRWYLDKATNSTRWGTQGLE
jgi:hypothetical protein